LENVRVLPATFFKEFLVGKLNSPWQNPPNFVDDNSDGSLK
jgi:hypothetical protein